MLAVSFHHDEHVGAVVISMAGVLDAPAAIRLRARLDAIGACPRRLDLARVTRADAAAVAALAAWFDGRHASVRVRADHEVVRNAFGRHAAFQAEGAWAA
jgi:ABC-type transporter Mla MlaB component